MHVFGRTSTGASRKYYYRRLEQGYWSAWKNINSEIEGDPILPVVWKNRLFLFWLSIVSKASNEAPLPSEDSDREVATLKISEVNYGGKTSFEANLCWSEYYNNKWQPKKTSDLNYPIIIPPVPQVFTENGPPINKPSLLRDIIQLTSIFHDDGSLEVGVNYLGLGRFATSLGVSPEAHSFMMRSFILNDTKSALQTVLNLDEPGRPLPISFPVRGMPRSSGRGNAVFPYFMIGYQLNSTTEGHSHQPLGADVRNQIVTNTDWAPVTNVVELPFYYQNENHVFLVKPEENPVTIHNYEYVFTDRGIFGQDMAIDKIKFPEIWEKPEITKPLPGLFDALMIPGTTLDTRTGGSKPIDFWDTDYPLNKVICDSKPIFYGNIAIGPLGSKNARLLCSNKIGIDSEFEIASTEKETQK